MSDLKEEIAKLDLQIEFMVKSVRKCKTRDERDALTIKIHEVRLVRDELRKAMKIGGSASAKNKIKKAINEELAEERKEEKHKPRKLRKEFEKASEPEVYRVESEQLVSIGSILGESSNGVDEARMMDDFVYFCENGCEIQYRPGMNQDHPLGGFGFMKLTEAQKKVISVFIHTLFVSIAPLRAIELKTRQLGNTTLLVAFVCWMMCRNVHYNAMIIIDKGVHFRTKRDMVLRWFDYLSTHYKSFPGVAKGGRGDKLITLTNGSQFFFESAESPNPGTSEMLHCLIESEKPKWPKGVASKIKNSVTPSIPFMPMTIHIDESTAMGHDDFYRKFVRATSVKDSAWIPIFLGWNLSSEYCVQNVKKFEYSDNKDYCDFDVDEDREISEEEHAVKYSLSKGQVLWRRQKIRDQFDGVRAGFDQEYPITPDHAFRYAQFGFFAKSLRDYMAKVQCNAERYDIYDVNGYTNTTVVCPYYSVSPELVPSKIGSLFVREMPVSGVEYFIGVDVCEGKVVDLDNGEKDPDYTVCSVKDSSGKTVAIHICREKPESYWLTLLLIAIFYNSATINGERNGVAGGVLLAFFWLTNYPGILITDKTKKTPKDGAWTLVTGANRSRMLLKLRASYTKDRDRPFPFCNGKETPLLQMSAFSVNAKDGKAEADVGFHDDIIFAEAHAEACISAVLGDDRLRSREKDPDPSPELERHSVMNTDVVEFSDSMWSEEKPEYKEFKSWECLESW